jgi:hypothetical protein
MKFSIGLKRSRRWNCLSLALARPHSISCSRFIEAQTSAMAALQHEHPKLTAMAIDSMDGASFAAMFDKAIARSQAPPKMIEHRPGETAPSVKWSGPLREG